MSSLLVSGHTHTHTHTHTHAHTKGIVFDDAHASSSLSTPSRYSILTGRHASTSASYSTTSAAKPQHEDESAPRP